MFLDFIPDRGKALFVGEGNFSFSTALAKQFSEGENTCELVLTCYETDPVSDLASANIQTLRDLGHRVLLGVDATNLAEVFPNEQFSLVAFMFPHVGGKMQIQRNRRLLRDFGVSVCDVLSRDNGKVAVALCAGQGGSDADRHLRPQRADTWQVVDMMSFGGLQAVAIEPLDVEAFIGYRSFGYRSLNKGFRSEGALLHVFEWSRKSLDGYLAASEAMPFLQDKLGTLTELDLKCEPNTTSHFKEAMFSHVHEKRLFVKSIVILL